MKLKLKTNFWRMLLALVLLGAGEKCLAIDWNSVDLTKGKYVESVLVATVNIDNAKLERLTGSDWKISFSFSNWTGVQPGVRYGVEVRTAKDGTLIDQVIYPDAISLGENEGVKKEIVYTAPDYLKGKFQIWVVSQNESGLPLGQAVAGEAVFSGTGKYVDLVNCAVRVSGDDKLYALAQGVDVSSEEELSLVCQAKNWLGADTTLVPHFQTTFRTAFGKIISEGDGSSIQVKKGSMGEVNFVIPKASLPQAYNVAVSFRDSVGKKVANSIAIHYVLRGTSATIQNVTLDKGVYDKGETAKVAVYWSGRADAFPGTRQEPGDQEGTILKISASNSRKQICMDDFAKEFDGQKYGGLEKLELPVVKNCQSGVMEVSLVDERGNILDQKMITFQKADEEPEAVVPSDNKVAADPKNGSKLLWLGLIGVGIVLALGVGVIFWLKKRKEGGMVGIFLLIFVASFFFSGKMAEAHTFAFSLVDVRWASANFTVNMSTEHEPGHYYCPNHWVRLIGSGSFSACSNTADTMNLKATFPNGAGWFFWTAANSFSNAIIDHQVGSVPGTYNAKFDGAVFLDNNPGDVYYTTLNVPFTILAGCFNAVCGSANGGNFATPPTANLCQDGSTPAVTLVGSTYNWTCTGDGDIHTVNCSANKVTYNCTGTSPNNAVVCSGDDSDLLADTPKTLTSSCSSPISGNPKCQFYCSPGFQYFSACASNGGAPCCEVPKDCGAVQSPTECSPGCKEKTSDPSGTRKVYYWYRGDDNLQCISLWTTENCTTPLCPRVYREVAP